MKRKTTAKEDRQIIRKYQNPRIASRDIVEMLKLSVSSKIVQRRLEMGLRYCKAKRKPDINQFNMRRLLKNI